jgi:hypothetical protein
VAPLAATLAASMALGAGVAIARAGRQQRTLRRRRSERRFGLTRGERLGSGCRRIALGQIDLALEQLQDGDRRQRRAVHETRKALKRLRALLRLLEPQLDPRTFARENAAVRDTARRLAGAREAEVMLGTFDALVARHPNKLAGRKGVARLRRELAREREQALGDELARAQAIVELRALRVRVEAWQLADGAGIELV